MSFRDWANKHPESIKRIPPKPPSVPAVLKIENATTCSKLLNRGIEIVNEISDDIALNRFDSADIGVTQLWEIGNLASIFSCTSAYWELRKMLKEGEKRLAKAKMERSKRILKWAGLKGEK